MAGFAHLHVASGYSARYGASHPEQLAKRSAERGVTSLALTDRDTVTGAVRFAQACAKEGSGRSSASTWRWRRWRPRRPHSARAPPHAVARM